MDELAGGWHGTERGGQPWQVVNLREVVGGTSPQATRSLVAQGLAR